MRGHVTARVLKAYRNKSWHVVPALAELLDNSFGEQRGNASSVRLEWNAKTRRLKILDDGQGMKDVADLFVFGQGETSGTGDIGLYGIGGSEALVWLSDYTDVATVRKGRIARTTADYSKCIDREEFPRINNRWKIPSAVNCPPELLGSEHGTLIDMCIRADLRIQPDVIQERLSRMFNVGLRTGRRITWTTMQRDGTVTETQLNAWDPGRMEDGITGTVAIGNGLSAQVHAGRVEGLSIANSKLSVNYLYRQVKETTAGFSRPVQGAVGNVDLSPQWLPYLTTTKDDIREDCRHLEEALMLKVAELLEPLVEQLRRARRAKVFSNVRINLKKKFEQGFDRPSSNDDEPSSPDESERPSPEPHAPRSRGQSRSPHAAVIEIEEASDRALNGLLCKAEINKSAASATGFINIDHPLVVLALESDPINQRLLEQILISALAKEIVEQDALVAFGLFSQPAADELLKRYNGNALDVVLYLIRVLTDGVVEAA
jgi:Histidine kinase-, DNA gyrase B-, and HSP90-like ATPase